MKVTGRDLYALEWLADMKACFEPDLGVLLGRRDGVEPLSADAMRKITGRWHRAGLAKAQKVLAAAPRVVMLQPNGGGLVGEPDYHAQSIWTLFHACEVSRARLWLEGQPSVEVPGLPAFTVAEWMSERSWRQNMIATTGRLAPGVHAPDGVVTTPGGRRVAIEVERTPKTARRLDTIMDALTVPGGWDAVLYLVTGTPAVRVNVEAAVQRAVARNKGRGAPVGVIAQPAAAALL